jgi:hypothetical protein
MVIDIYLTSLIVLVLTGNWANYHLLDVLRLLDHKGKIGIVQIFLKPFEQCQKVDSTKINSLVVCFDDITPGFTCYWLSGTSLWRITGCYFDVYDSWHGWSNVGCVHRSYVNLAMRMEDRFNSTLFHSI